MATLREQRSHKLTITWASGHKTTTFHPTCQAADAYAVAAMGDDPNEFHEAMIRGPRGGAPCCQKSLAALEGQS
jgi:hypothetical protein